jgi:hypothetical protein
MGIQRLFTPSSSADFVKDTDAVKSGQSNSATFAALAGVLAAAGAGIPGIIKATGVNAKTTTAQAAVLIAVLLFAAISVVAVAWVMVADYKTRANVTIQKGTKGTNSADGDAADGTAKNTSGAAAKPPVSSDAMLKIVDEQAELPVLTARYDDQSQETVYLAVVANKAAKWVHEKDVTDWVTPPGADAGAGGSGQKK